MQGTTSSGRRSTEISQAFTMCASSGSSVELGGLGGEGGVGGVEEEAEQVERSAS